MSDLLLKTLADTLDDVERLRIATANRLRILTGTEPDADGVVRGFGLTENNHSVHILRILFEDFESIEDDTTKELQRVMKAHPLGPWVKSQKGVGEKQAARLLAAIGDPYWNAGGEFENEDGTTFTVAPHARTVSQLWAYAGLHVDDSGQSVRRRRGVQSNWKTLIKMRAYLISTSCIKNLNSPYRAVYDARREHTAITHPDWTLGHSHNDALRIVSKTLLRDMWIESKRLHEAH